jgi:hypothetical protein
MSKIHDFPSTARRDLHNITGWLADLANMTAGTSPLADAKAKIASLASGLVEEYPPAAFTRGSLLHVARQCKFMPSYAELTTHLTAWWNDNRPVLPALPAPYEHVETAPRTKPTTNELESLADILDRNDAFLHAKYDAIYNRNPKQSAALEPRVLNRALLADAYRAAGIPGPKVAS